MKNIFCQILVVLALLFSLSPIEQEIDESTHQNNEVIQDLIHGIEKSRPPEIEYDKFCTNAETIVIAKLVTKEFTDWSNIPLSERDRDIDSSLPVFNELQVLARVKGNCENSIRVVTTQWKESTMVLMYSNFATLVTTKLVPERVSVDPLPRQSLSQGDDLAARALEIEADRKQVVVSTKEVEPIYLLFLRKKDDLYFPITGLRYSGSSVFELSEIERYPSTVQEKMRENDKNP